MLRYPAIIFFILLFGPGLTAQTDSADYGRIKVAKPDSSVILHDLAKSSWQKGKNDSCIICENRSILLNPGYARAYCGLCACYYEKFNYTEAVKVCLISVSLDSLQYSAYFNLGLCFAAVSDFKQAIHYQTIAAQKYDGSGKTDTDLGDIYFERGSDYEKIGELKKAERDMKRASSLGNKNALSWIETRKNAKK